MDEVNQLSYYTRLDIEEYMIIPTLDNPFYLFCFSGSDYYDALIPKMGQDLDSLAVYYCSSIRDA